MANLIKNFIIFLIFLFIGALIPLAYLKTQKNSTTFQAPKLIAPIQLPREGSVSNSPIFSLENSPTESMRGSLTELSGNVFWKSRTATQSAALPQTVQIQQGEEVGTGEDGNLTVHFSNGRSLSIFPKSHVNIIQTLPGNLVLQQTDGTVTYKNSGKLPLAVRALGLLTQFEGGEVKISVNQTASVVSVQVIGGSAVAAYNDLKYLSHVLTVFQGKLLTFNDLKKRISLKPASLR